MKMELGIEIKLICFPNGNYVWVDIIRGGATVLRVGVQISLRAKRAENFFGLYPHICHSGGTTATKRGIRRAYRTALLQW